jgi:hypothetical protein
MVSAATARAVASARPAIYKGIKVNRARATRCSTSCLMVAAPRARAPDLVAACAWEILRPAASQRHSMPAARQLVATAFRRTRRYATDRARACRPEPPRASRTCAARRAAERPAAGARIAPPASCAIRAANARRAARGRAPAKQALPAHWMAERRSRMPASRRTQARTPASAPVVKPRTQALASARRTRAAAAAASSAKLRRVTTGAGSARSP